MTTATTTTPLDHTTDAGYNTWVSEIITMLFTTLGLTQTADTGQTNGSGLTRPGTSTVNAYIVGRFNDTAQSTNPIFFRIDFGTGGTTTTPAMRLTVGTGSNGSGTINGLTTLAACAMTVTGAASSNTTAYLTRACYNSTDGVFWLAWKYNSQGNANVTQGGCLIFRSADNTGAQTTDSTMIVTGGGSANGAPYAGSSAVFVQVISHLNNQAYTSAPWPSSVHSFVTYGLTATLFSGNAQVFPEYQYTPVIGITPWWAIVVIADLGVGSTISATLVGTSAHTYINAGSVFGTTSTFGVNSLNINTTFGNLLPWE